MVEKKKLKGRRSCRVCACAQRTAKNLRFVSQVLGRESLVTKDFIASGPLNCESLQKEWKEWTAQQAKKVYGEGRFVFQNAIKGTKTLFDEPCEACDPRAGEEAKRTWRRKALEIPGFSAGEERHTDPDVLKDIRRRVRKIMGRGWWKERTREYVPDQQGCLEQERGCGGTLSASFDWESDLQRAEKLGIPDSSFAVAVREDDPRLPNCRLGVAKSKGKMRVVTMQSALMKSVLRPVHEAAYDRISRRPWLVRGAVTKEHFESLRWALYPGHHLNSGDYEASTDNLHKDAVLAVVETLSEELPAREARLFVQSFKECAVENSWCNCQEAVMPGVFRYLHLGEECPVVRGSMMGNLGSFVVLCLLNRIAFERALKLCGYPPNHPCLLNGDDILFPGESGLYHSWLHSTKEVGFVINKSKTMRSKTYGDLNSQTYRYDKSRMVKKLCFGFLGSDSWKQPEGSLCTPLFELCQQLSFSTAAWLLVAFPVRKLLARAPLPLSSIPRRWWGFLVKKSWFRGLMDQSTFAVEESGTERALPFVVGPPIHTTPYLESRIREMEDHVTRPIVKEWQGIPVCPLERKLPHRTFSKLRCKFRLRRAVLGWQRLWLAPVLEFVKFNCPSILVDGYPDWVDDQPGLQLSYQLIRTPMRRPFCFAPQLVDFVPFVRADGSKIFRAC
nr:MAG: putative RNA-dependent RNA polymerase [Sanya botourmia-like virus 2]